MSKIETCVLEVERKFQSLAVRDLTAHCGNPGFRSLRPLGQKLLHDVYYDRQGLLSSSGLWVRRRNGEWEAKVKQGGNFTNSRLEELNDVHSISKLVEAITGDRSSPNECFGLNTIAEFTTTRQSWIADGEFKIVLDDMDFGHTVGEIEKKEILITSQLSIDQQKGAILQEMDEKIARFMDRYAWAFHVGTPKGKLTAYLERKASN